MAICIATCSPKRIDPRLLTGFFNGTGSRWGGYNTAPAPHGPGFCWHDPSVKANGVSSGAYIIKYMTISFPSSVCSWVRDLEEPSLLQ